MYEDMFLIFVPRALCVSLISLEAWNRIELVCLHGY